MENLLYLAGLIIGIALFLYALSFYEDSKEKIKKRLSDGGKIKSDNQEVSINPQTISYQDRQEYPRERFCPICRAVLTRFEALYAFQIEDEKEKKIMIYGCRYCYRPDKEPEQ